MKLKNFRSVNLIECGGLALALAKLTHYSEFNAKIL